MHFMHFADGRYLWLWSRNAGLLNITIKYGQINYYNWILICHRQHRFTTPKYIIIGKRLVFAQHVQHVREVKYENH